VVIGAPIIVNNDRRHAQDRNVPAPKQTENKSVTERSALYPSSARELKRKDQ
jgi:hypothetical protein